MLGALVIAIEVLLFWACWNLNKSLEQKKAAEVVISFPAFALCSLLNILVFVPIMWLIFTLVSLTFQKEDSAMVFGGILAVLSVLCFIGYQYKRYGIKYELPQLPKPAKKAEAVVQEDVGASPLGLWKKYKWYAIGYIIYVCFMSTIVADEYEWNRGHKYWSYWIIWCAMLPLIGYSLWHFVLYIKSKK